MIRLTLCEFRSHQGVPCLGFDPTIQSDMNFLLGTAQKLLTIGASQYLATRISADLKGRAQHHSPTHPPMNPPFQSGRICWSCNDQTPSNRFVYYRSSSDDVTLVSGRQTSLKFFHNWPRCKLLIILLFFGIYSENRNKPPFIKHVQTTVLLMPCLVKHIQFLRLWHAQNA